METNNLSNYTWLLYPHTGPSGNYVAGVMWLGTEEEESLYLTEFILKGIQIVCWFPH